MLMWWRSAVNFSFFLCLAACRTRSNACDTRSRPCVRCVLCWLAFPMRTGGGCRTADREISRFPRKERLHMPGSLTTPGRPGARGDAPGCVAFRHLHGVGTQNRNFRGSMAGLCAPLSTLRRHPRGHLRMTRGRCGSLLLHRKGFAPSTPCRSPGASQIFNKAFPVIFALVGTIVGYIFGIARKQ